MWISSALCCMLLFTSAQANLWACTRTPTQCVEKGVYYDGELLSKGSATSAHHCSCKCTWHNEGAVEAWKCNSWTYSDNFPTYEHCVLKKGDVTRVEYPKPSDAVSGRTECIEAMCTPKDCIEPGVYYIGGDMQSHSSVDMTANACSCRCEYLPGCNAWTFMGKADGGMNRCSLKNLEGEVTRNENSGAVSGKTECTKSSMCTPTTCVEKGVYYNGKRIRIIDSADMSAVKCSCECKGESDCNSWTFSENVNGDGKNRCWLKKGDVTRVEYPKPSEAVSGRTECIEAMCTPLHCIEKGVYYNGKRIRIIDSDDMNAVKCSCQCNDEFYCNSWTFSENVNGDGKNRCWLKKGDVTRVKYSENSEAVSGRKSCTKRSQTKKRMCTPSLCVEKGVYYNGIRIRIIDSDDMSAVKCSCKCKEESDCNSWTFNGNKCWLKKGGVARVEYPKPSDAVSGRTECIEGICGTPKHCIEYGVYYSGATIGTYMNNPEVKTAEECSCKCKTSSYSCKYWTFIAQQDGKRLNKCILKRKGMGDLIGLRYEYPAETVAASGKTECTNRSGTQPAWNSPGTPGGEVDQEK